MDPLVSSSTWKFNVCKCPIAVILGRFHILVKFMEESSVTEHVHGIFTIKGTW